MLFLSIIDDFLLQRVAQLGALKQRKWWHDNYPQLLYKNDYAMALYLHSFSWTFMMMLPIAIAQAFAVTPLFVIVFGLNVIVHAFVDNLKANLLKINLITDQCIHFVQICITIIIFYWFV
jgi:hypothetical protein